MSSTLVVATAHFESVDNSVGNQNEIEIVTKENVTIGPLNPTGIIMFDGVEKPAKSQGDFIPDGTKVKVMGTHAFGFLVEPAEETNEAKRE